VVVEYRREFVLVIILNLPMVENLAMVLIVENKHAILILAQVRYVLISSSLYQKRSSV